MRLVGVDQRRIERLALIADRRDRSHRVPAQIADAGRRELLHQHDLSGRPGRRLITPVAPRRLQATPVRPEIRVVEPGLEQLLKARKQRADVEQRGAAVAAHGSRGDIVDELLLDGCVLRRVGPQDQFGDRPVRALGNDVLGKRIQRRRLQAITERLDGQLERRKLPTEVQRAADRVQQVLHGDEVAHFLAGDLQQRVPDLGRKPPDVVLGRKGSRVDRIGSEQVLDHQRVLDLGGRRQPEDRLVARPHPRPEQQRRAAAGARRHHARGDRRMRAARTCRSGTEGTRPNAARFTFLTVMWRPSIWPITLAGWKPAFFDLP